MGLAACATSMKLNLGGGGHNPDGYVEIDRATGHEIYPLPYEDGSVDIVRASHVLEHFSHKVIGDVVKEWVRVLKPSGLLRIAVPDFRKIVQWYAEGRRDLPLQLYLMGGQRDDNDYHKSVFEAGLLRQVMVDAGLVNIKPWVSELTDNASWEVSLNLQGEKPEASDNWIESIEPFNVYSQFGEDGYLAAIFERIGVDFNYCVDVGAADGILFSNVRRWLEKGWGGVLIEKDDKRYDALVRNTGTIGFDKIRCHRREVKPTGESSLDSILLRENAPLDFDLLSIDVDGQDYYIWNSLLCFKPRVVVIEYDPEADPMFIPQLGGAGQAGSRAMMYVAAARGYLTVKQTQTNLICVRKDICEKFFEVKGKEYGHAKLDSGNVDRNSDYHSVIIRRHDEAKVEGSSEQPEGSAPASVAPQNGDTASPPVAEPVTDVAGVLLDEPKPLKICAVISVPRLGFNANWHSTIKAMIALQIHVEMVEGAFWHACLTRGIEKVLALGADIILTIDYDSVFDVQHVIKLCQLLGDHPEYSAIVPVQAKREANQVLFQTNGDNDFAKPLTNIATGHFGLTVFDARVFDDLPKPWFYEVPSPNGDWNDGRVDSDIAFWNQFTASGYKVGLANDVRVGHLELQISWVSKDMRKVFQSVTDYRKDGQPLHCGGDLKIELQS